MAFVGLVHTCLTICTDRVSNTVWKKPKFTYIRKIFHGINLDVGRVEFIEEIVDLTQFLQNMKVKFTLWTELFTTFPSEGKRYTTYQPKV